MMRSRLAAALLCALAGAAAAQPRTAPNRLLDAPVFTIRPQGALPGFIGEGVNVVVGWRPVGEATRYRVTLMTPDGKATDVETKGLRFEKQGLAPGRYQLTVTAIDKSGIEGAISDPLPLNVIEVRAVPPGAEQALPPRQGAYAAGTRFSVPAMHCEVSKAPIDDLLVLPENELRLTTPGAATLRCAGIPGYLEKKLIVAPITVAVQSKAVMRGATTIVRVTLGSVGYIGPRLDVQPLGDITLGEPERTEFGIDIPVAAPRGAKTAGFTIQTGTFQIARIDLELVDAPEPPPPARSPLDWAALDVGAQLGLFVPPSGTGGAPSIGHPLNPGDAVTTGPFAGARLGFFPIPRVGLEAELSIIAAGYADDDAGVAQILATRGQLAVRAVESGRFGLRLFVGAGAWTTLGDRGSSQSTSVGEVHGGAAFSVETGRSLSLRFQLADLVTTARDGGYAHVIEAQLGIVTRFGRRDSF
ncbi:MAG TPA: hypothetical protein VIV11_26590 [Kofleriaceae bacterium]